MGIVPRTFRLFVCLFCLFSLPGVFSARVTPQNADVPAKLTYLRIFKGSAPEYLNITIDLKGSGTFEGHKLDETQSPRPIQLSPGTTNQIFALVAQLHDFRSIDLESHRKVANLGQKTLEYQAGNEVSRVSFNYTENKEAQDLVDILEKIGTVEEHITALEFDMKYDRLGLSQELSLIQFELRSKKLTSPELLLPTLEKIVHDSRFLHIAQVRSQEIIESIQSNP